MVKPEISVIMSCYDETTLELQRSINSILNQSFKNFEFIIIIDNPKNKNISDLVKSFMRKDTRIKLIENKKNIGLASSLNIGIKSSIGKYLVRMDADDFSNINRFESQYDYMIKHNKIDILFCWAKYVDSLGKIIKLHSPSNILTRNLKFNFFKKHLFVHPTLFCKRYVLINNLYDETFLRAQDFELWLRLIKSYNFSILEKYLFNYTLKNGIKNFKSRNLTFKQAKYGCIALFKNFYLFKFNLNYYFLLVKFILIYVILFIYINFKNGYKKINSK
jgi:glycosyltransferase involved in cell wall biosynthesis